jgi:ABC-type polysaccharide/polyol phosphate transport system ATPase subunit
MRKRSTSLLEAIRNLARPKNQERRVILEECNLELRAGSIYRLQGANGVGKTSLMRLLGKIFPPNSGSVETQGLVFPLLHPRITFHFHFDLRQTIEMFLELYQIPVEQGLSQVIEDLKSWNVEDLLDRKLRQMSPGQCSMAFLAVTRVVRPQLLLIDELLSHCDSVVFKRWLDELHAIRNRGGTVVVVSHDQSDRIGWVDGTIEFQNRKLLLKTHLPLQDSNAISPSTSAFV